MGWVLLPSKAKPANRGDLEYFARRRPGTDAPMGGISGPGVAGAMTPTVSLRAS